MVPVLTLKVGAATGTRAVLDRIVAADGTPATTGTDRTTIGSMPGPWITTSYWVVPLLTGSG